jgi:predicted metal-dependent hydrolase
MDSTQITLEGRHIPLSIRRHRRARRISLRLSPARDGIVMTLPARASVHTGMDFFHSKAGWVLANVETGASVTLTDGAVIPILGEEYTIRRMPGRGVTALSGSELHVHSVPEFVARRVRDFLKKYLHEACMKRAQPMAAQLGKAVRDIKIRDTRSRWGSCSSGGSLTFHWQLVFGPAHILDYLVAHEVSHLKEMSHSARFWKVVALFYPDHATARKWLKREGHRLHRYGK